MTLIFEAEFRPFAKRSKIMMKRYFTLIIDRAILLCKRDRRKLALVTKKKQKKKSRNLLEIITTKNLFSLLQNLFGNLSNCNDNML